MTAAAAHWDWQELSTVKGATGPATEAELQALREEELETAYRRGRTEGEEAAHARARREVSTAVAAAQRVLQDVQEARESWERQREENLVALATAVARQIADRELRGDADTYRALVKKAAAAFPADQAVKVRIHPEDLSMISAAASGNVPDADVTGGRDARWIADEAIVRGGCILEGPNRIVDGRVDEALERIFWELTSG